MARSLSWALSFAGVVLIGLSAYVYVASEVGPDLQAKTDFTIADASAGDRRDITIALRNNTGKAIRVLGLSMC